MIDALEEIHLRTTDWGYSGVVEAENEVIGRCENEGKRRKIVVAIMDGGRISVGGMECKGCVVWVENNWGMTRVELSNIKMIASF